ncbi:PadR family transcriptional regulator [Arthrobacter sulfonylureivorans]|uniref:PadR family transcriptional regulator n=1 Tax=Arthrobacter sulfonylureivorans TaxID=2486855 RepID=A0ABY3W8F8_9MICC|nr:PadR family transcriptional regulator [Arthrobacter sulfonylureivorans]UNK46618.1 PadR family transcriptional regulator [Arthrobacter sulfonylureivorans]
MQHKQWPAEWMRGVLGLCVLKSLEPGPTYGYAIASALESAGLGAVKGGTLYPLLTRLESNGLVTTEWRAGEGGPGRKYFRLTPEGLAELERQQSQWRHFTGIVHAHLNAEEYQP